MDFIKRYKKLNTAQKEAVDCIEGPVMVIAGPGTGKTELLSVRAANILQKTDTLPENILCLTFTDSGANAMRKRLTETIGSDAYKVAIHTFHSFCVEVINQNSQYFFNGAQYKPADELSAYEIISEILSGLRHNNPLISKQNEQYTQLKDIATAISQIKKGGLSSEELEAILDANDQLIVKIEPILATVFANRVSKATIALANESIQAIRDIKQTTDIKQITSLSVVIADSLENAVIEAGEKDTKPITAWKSLWTKKDDDNNLRLKSHERQVRLHALNEVYKKYLEKMQKAQIYDFDDMILQVVHKVENTDELRFNLHEKYQYIMVDEFQDTNMAQMRILRNLTNNPAHGDTPNIMVVGDDDQAIYSFQGADISNIIDFRNIFKSTKVITLTSNYRSGQDILKHSRNIVLKGKNRLENFFGDINKQLVAATDKEAKVNLYETENIVAERQFIANEIRLLIDAGQSPSEITVIANQHKEIYELLPYLYDKGILVNYERQDNVLETDIIKLIENVSKFLIYLQSGRHDDANGIIPIILAHPAFGIEPVMLWHISTTAYDQHKRWLDIMSESIELASIHNWLLECAKLSSDMPLEPILDIIIGKIDKDEQSGYISPIYEYFFNESALHTDPEKYLMFLESLRTIREQLRQYHPEQTPNLQTFVEFISLNRKMGRTVELAQKGTKIDSAINVMTAHKSKGLEFDTVFVINAVDSNWSKSGGHSQSISYPENLALTPAGDTADEKLRLFYVAMTRAKKQLNISYSLLNDKNKGTLKASFLVDDNLKESKIDCQTDIQQLTKAAELNWYQPIVSPITPKMNELLKNQIDNYKLSATHLNSFVDITRGGPSAFLLNHLLRFPSAKSASADFGTAIHYALQSAHNHLITTGERMSIPNVIDIFTENLSKQHLMPVDLRLFTKKGIDTLQAFLENSYNSFNDNQKTELSFAKQQSMVDTAHLTGKLDVVTFDAKNKTVVVTDYKTGKPAESEIGKTGYEKIKIHKFKQQLMFYKLLIESSRDFHSYKVEKGIIQFVEPTKSGKITQIVTDFSDEDLDNFKLLICAVWRHITNLDFPDVSEYDQSLKGIIKFEDDLIKDIA